MRLRIFLALVCTSVFAAQAYTAKRVAEIEQMLLEEPRADGARIDDRAAWGRLAALPEAAAIIARARKCAEEKVPDPTDALYLEFTQNGNRTHYQKPYFELRNAIDDLLVAECLENRGRYIPSLVTHCEKVLALRSWVLPAHDDQLTCFNGKPHVDLFAGELAFVLACVRDWLGARLPEALRVKIRSEIDQRILNPHLANARDVAQDPKKCHAGHWWLHSRNNWNSVCNCYMLRLALAVVEDRRLRAEFVAIAEESAPYAIAGYTNDGYCSEGMAYWNYGYGHHLMATVSLLMATCGKINLSADPKCREIMKYAYGFQLEVGKSPNFADGCGNPGPSNLALGRYIWPDITSTVALSTPILQGGADMFSLRAFAPLPPHVKPSLDVLPARTAFPIAQVWLCRTPHLAVAFKGGHNDELHNHNDVGSYTVMCDGLEMAGDPGGEIYTRRTFSKDRYVSKVLNSFGHPVPVVAGTLQSTGRKAAAQVLKTRFTEDEDAVTISYAAAYAVKHLKTLTRTFTFNRKNRYFTVTDHFSAAQPLAFETPVITYLEYEKGTTETNLKLFKRGAQQTITVQADSSSPLRFNAEDIENPNRPTPHRLAFALAVPQKEATVSITYQFIEKDSK